MTLPFEMYNSMTYARNFLRWIANPTRGKRIPPCVRQEARAVLKHYPCEWDTRDMVSLFADVRVASRTLNRAVKGETSIYCPIKGGWVFYDKMGMNISDAYETKEEAERQRMMARAIDRADGKKKATVAKRKTRRI